MKYARVRGMNDIMPGEIGRWQRIEQVMREISKQFNYQEIRFPIVEYTHLFTRGIGSATEVVTKQMFTFPDQKGRRLSLRPEGTASVARAYLSHGCPINAPFQKLYYLGPMFRYEKPQKGRYRQFHQYGIEAIGSLKPSLDVEVMSFAWAMMNRLEIEGLTLRLNSIGCEKDRETYREALSKHFSSSISSMCPDCQRRYKDNPLRVLDCKESSCQSSIGSAPGSVEHLCSDCRAHFDEVCTLLHRLSLPFVLDPHLVRGLDYYSRTVFELTSSELGSQDSLLGGGRYDGLIESVGGPSTPGVGFAGGIERLVLVMQEAELTPEQEELDLFLLSIGEEGHRCAIALAMKLRQSGFSVEIDHRQRSLKRQQQLANKLKASYFITIGDNEAMTGTVRIRNLSSGEVTPVSASTELAASDDSPFVSLIVEPLERRLRQLLQREGGRGGSKTSIDRKPRCPEPDSGAIPFHQDD